MLPRRSSPEILGDGGKTREEATLTMFGFLQAQQDWRRLRPLELSVIEETYAQAAAEESQRKSLAVPRSRACVLCVWLQVG
jgi:hypothetical protein